MQQRNDIDLKEFETLLNERLAHTQENILGLNEELGDVSGGDTINDVEDLASLKTLNDSDHTLLDHQEAELQEIYHALSKIKNGTFGICEKTSKPIPVERLRANPIARYIVGAEA